jgi:hypothetical protein
MQVEVTRKPPVTYAGRSQLRPGTLRMEIGSTVLTVRMFADDTAETIAKRCNEAAGFDVATAMPPPPENPIIRDGETTLRPRTDKY